MQSLQFLYYNGDFYPVDNFCISKSNRAIRYGDSLFETIRVVEDDIKNLGLHLARLEKGIKTIGIEPNSVLKQGAIQDIFKKLKHKNKLKGNLKLRIQVNRAGEGLYTPTTNLADILIELTSYPDGYIFFNTEKWLDVGISKESFVPITPFMGCKTANALPYILAGVEKQKLRKDDLILTDIQGNLSECISSNLFIYDVETNILYTPDLGTGCLDGTIRKVIISESSKYNLKIQEGFYIANKEFFKNKIVFTTNSSSIHLIGRIEDIYQIEDSKKRAFLNSDLYSLIKNIE
jgi:branched-subunit amino acid aminotransferase/4-amino-4-deoxychorismate lyase